MLGASTFVNASGHKNRGDKGTGSNGSTGGESITQPHGINSILKHFLCSLKGQRRKSPPFLIVSVVISIYYHRVSQPCVKSHNSPPMNFQNGLRAMLETPNILWSLFRRPSSRDGKIPMKCALNFPGKKANLHLPLLNVFAWCHG